MSEQKSTRGTVNTRELALDMLMDITAGRVYSHVIIRNVLDKYDYIGVQEKSFLKRLTEGTLERMIQLDYCINQYASVPVRKQKPFIRNLLRLSVYQLLFMDSAPDSAVCDEAVKLAQKRGFVNLKGFVNGVLRNIARNKDGMEYPDRKEDAARYLSIRYSMPEWIVRMWLEDYGEETAEKMLEGLLAEHAVTVRLRESLDEAGREAALSGMKAQGIEVKAHPWLPYAYRLGHTEGLPGVEAFAQGQLYVQDVSSMLVAEAAGIRGGERILDVCAAPGGKALHAADKLMSLGMGGSVEARDVSEEKTSLIDENIQRMHAQGWIHTKVWDAVTPDESAVAAADILYADLPCSGLGIIGKKRDIKYNITEEATEELVCLQREILSAVQGYVKKGGCLIYSTCTIDKKENEEQLQWLLQEFDFEPVSLEGCLPEKLCCRTAKDGYVQLLPGVHDCDGFFIAKLRKL